MIFSRFGIFTKRLFFYRYFYIFYKKHLANVERYAIIFMYDYFGNLHRLCL